MEGEIEPRFAKKYANELMPTLQIIDDIKDIEHCVGYNMNLERPRLTTGWNDLHDFYKLSEEHHPIMLCYYGGNVFHMLLIVYPKLYMSEIPDWHSLYGIHDDSIQFDKVIPSLETENIKWVSFVK
jgi:hypothetical protein